MIQNILKKAIDLLKDGDGKSLEELSGRVTYVLGMLETLYEIQEQKEPLKNFIAQVDKVFDSNVGKKDEPLDEASIMDAKARAALETVKALGGKQE